jgi:alkaline phosphatase D
VNIDSPLSRRTFVAGGAFAGAGLILGGVPVGAGAGRRRTPFANKGKFSQGVASGEPSTNAMTLWTRLDGYKADRLLTVEVARDKDFKRVVFRRNVTAKATEDSTVKLRVTKGLKPGERYYYRFETKNSNSPVGRFQTLRPADSEEAVKIVFFSCQDYQSGFYGAHQAIAREDADLVICLGDYIYEKTFYEGPRKDTLGANGDGEVLTLPEYRDKYKLYKADKDLQAMHAAQPFMAIWDDHEVEDNYAGTNPGEAAGDRRGVAFSTRRRNGYRAYFEHMPFRRPGRTDFRLYTTVKLGKNAEVFLLDERQYRDDQPCGDDLFVPCPEAETGPQSLLGKEQLNWLKSGLEKSGANWKLVGNQLMIMAFELNSTTPINKDAWDGYGRERRELLQHVQDKGIKDVSFLTGDIHTFFAGDVGVDGRGPESVATEFVGGSVTSLGIREGLAGQGVALGSAEFETLAATVRAANPHIKYDELESRGYGVVEASPAELKVAFKGVTATTRSTTARSLANFRVARGTANVIQT